MGFVRVGSVGGIVLSGCGAARRCSARPPGASRKRFTLRSSQAPPARAAPERQPRQHASRPTAAATSTAELAGAARIERTLQQVAQSPVVVCFRFTENDVNRYHGDARVLEHTVQALRQAHAPDAPEYAAHEWRCAALTVLAARAVMDGGLTTLELTMTTPGALLALRELCRTCPEHAVIGAGTVLSAAQLESAVRAGCRFAMSPVTMAECTPHLSQYAGDHGVLFIPGAATPSECAQAHRYAHLHGPVKVFPIDTVGGLRFVRALAGPLPHIPLLPTSGVTLDSVEEYLHAPNVFAVGASRQILPPEALRAGHWGAIGRRASQWHAVLPRRE
ncbi:hypothetical protein CDCA_CDCA05G1492 [Cyanidium caldarium]|uniref:Uncharacterized protein n=1 Tax=Cyanidium caldarium TaxID=2771 RepID=A0AAV9IT16_CYACA|nr:hypothetical protein CDCA_CDCA05G1492 [Cyanidium caldarium]